MLRKTFFASLGLAIIIGLGAYAESSFARGYGGGGGRGGGYSGGTRGGFYSSGGSYRGAQTDRAGFSSANRGDYNAGGDYGGRSGNWNNYYYGRGGYGGYGGYGGWRGWGWGGGWGYWPWLAGWGLGWGYPGGYNYYYPDNGYYSYGVTGTGASAVGGPTVAQPSPPANPPSASSSDSDDQQVASEGFEYYSQARNSFLSGDYRSALRFAGHAAIDSPQNPRVHELISLCLFALGNYQAAASEATCRNGHGTCAGLERSVLLL